MSYIYIYAGNKNAKLQNERFERRPTKYISSWQVAISTCMQYLISWTACCNYFKYCITYMNLENVNILIVSKYIFAPLYMYYWSLLRILSCICIIDRVYVLLITLMYICSPIYVLLIVCLMLNVIRASSDIYMNQNK